VGPSLLVVAHKRELFDDFYGNERTITGPLFQQDEVPLGGATGDEKDVAKLISEHRGAANPISIARIRERLALSERQVKGIVERLVVDYRLKIGARREEPSGYFLICTSADLQAAVGPYKAQILAMWKRLRVLEEKQALRELLGQLRLED
jgi:hypothetical protein